MKLPTICLPAIHSPLSCWVHQGLQQVCSNLEMKNQGIHPPTRQRSACVWTKARLASLSSCRPATVHSNKTPCIPRSGRYKYLSSSSSGVPKNAHQLVNLATILRVSAIPSMPLYAMLHPVLQGCQSVLRPLWSDSHHGLLGVPVWLQCVPGEWVTVIWCPRVTKQREIETRPVRTLASITTLEESLPIGMENRQSTTAPLGWNL